jgi:maltooligosyltrehalose trehalohydrolase
LEGQGAGFFERRLPGVGPGTLYKFVLDGRELPDPFARFLPFGVHGPAEVIERKQARPAPSVPPLHRYVIYELHVGTFTAEGTYTAAGDRLGHLGHLGVTAVELMPLSSFPGRRGWGYDGVAHFAPFAPYGRPDELRAFVERVHASGLAVLLDVVYNHFGPRGNYLEAYAAEYFTVGHGSPWGAAPNFGHPAMREYVLSNARMWFDEFGFDGLRLDAVHALRDPAPIHILRELRDLAASYVPAKTLIAEDDRNDPAIIQETGLDAVWADDFHHEMRVVLTGEGDGYYAAYEPKVEALARTIEHGWLFQGEMYEPWGTARGRPPGALAPEHFVYCIENHDQIGNRALGERLDRDAGIDALRTATLVLLFLPMTPLLFMGQEWASSSPFLYFTDHDPEFGPQVSNGRRNEFRAFKAFASDEARARIPDPQARATFEQSKLRWEEADCGAHRAVYEAVRAMLQLRREDPVLSRKAPCDRRDLHARAEGCLLVVERRSPMGCRQLVANLSPEAHSVEVGPGSGEEALLRVGEVGAARMGPYALVVWRA